MSSLVTSLHNNLCTQMLFLSKHVPTVRLLPWENICVVQSDVKDDTFNFIVDTKLQENDDLSPFILAFEREKLPFSWWIGPLDTPSSLISKLKQLGLKQTEENIGMALDINDYCISPKLGNINIIKITNQTQLKEWCEILIQIGITAQCYSDIYSKISEEILISSEVEFYIGYTIDSKFPICTGMLVNSNEVAGIYNIATLPKYRRNGYASSMMNNLIQRAKQLNLKYITLTASPEGKYVYEPLGFQAICSYFEYSK